MFNPHNSKNPKQTKMSKISPKIEIINRFDDLINKIDIDFDICLEKYDDKIN